MDKKIHTLSQVKVRGTFNKFPDFFFVQAFNILKLKIHSVISIHLMRWLTNFYDFGFKCTAIAAIRIHSTKAWLSQLVNFKNPIWHFRRTICNKIVLNLEKIPQKRMECFRLILEHLAWIEHLFLCGIRDSRKVGSLWEMMRRVV